MEYKTTAKLVIQACDKDLPGVFGHGCVLLLQGIAREHSLNRAAKSMGMAYSKAWRIVNEELQADINNVIATKANDLIASIKE